MTESENIAEIRRSVQALCADFPGAYWREKDSARAYPGGPAWPDAADGTRVQRGASAWGSPRLRHPRARQAVAAGRDDGFVGFRSCAV
mgnify:CR=1 FL=1